MTESVSAQAASLAGSAEEAPVRIVIVGAGPAAVMVLERLLASHRRDYAQLRLQIELIDPYPPGGGRIWRREQSPLLKLNTTLQDAAVFTDASCSVEGPIETGPTFAEWVERVRAGEIPKPQWSDSRLEREIDEIQASDFPTRRLNNAYLSWAYLEVLRRASDRATVTWHEDLVVASRPDEEAKHAVRLRSGKALKADIVLYALGHNGSVLGAQSERIAEFADQYGLRYVPPAFTADVDFAWLAGGEDVIVRGMGLAAVDLSVLLGEGRGGSFARNAAGVLRYSPSGHEPVIHLGSRRGVPYHSKVSSSMIGDPIQLEYVGAAFREWALARPERLDFERDVWPLICAELLTGHYRELFTGYPQRVTSDWQSFSSKLREVLEEDRGFSSAALTRLISEHVPDPDDRFEISSFDRPLDFVGDAYAPVSGNRADEVGSARRDQTLQSVQAAVIEHIRRDLRQRTSPDRSASQALFLTGLYAFISIAELPADRWNARSRTDDLPRRWHTFFSYLASGPPGERLEELLALAEAGVVRFLGADVELQLDEKCGQFVASGVSKSQNGTAEVSVSARVLIDAWLPEAQAAKSDNPLLKQLVAEGHAKELRIEDAEHQGSTGQVVVDADGRLSADSPQFALGPFTSLPTAGAFARPGIDSLPFRTHDRCARAILSAAFDLSLAKRADLARSV